MTRFSERTWENNASSSNTIEIILPKFINSTESQFGEVFMKKNYIRLLTKLLSINLVNFFLKIHFLENFFHKK